MPTTHLVKQGECIASIAEAYGFFWETLWNLPENLKLKQLRQEPTILQEGDVVHIPDVREKTEDRSTEARHRFVLKGVPALLRLRIMQPSDTAERERTAEPPDQEQHEVVFEDPEPEKSPSDEPWSNAAYTLEVDGEWFKGMTDRDGKLEVKIRPAARSGTLIMEPGTPRERQFTLALGHLDPATTVSGVADRLNHLGYGSVPHQNETTPELVEAIRNFQRDNGLNVTGDADKATQDKLKNLHGS